eukprot:scaffold149527_cov30-Tisochrysis_lutea.AAC.3
MSQYRYGRPGGSTSSARGVPQHHNTTDIQLLASVRDVRDGIHSPPGQFETRLRQIFTSRRQRDGQGVRRTNRPRIRVIHPCHHHHADLHARGEPAEREYPPFPREIPAALTVPSSSHLLVSFVRAARADDARVAPLTEAIPVELPEAWGVAEGILGIWRGCNRGTTGFGKSR